jgi:phage terminase large subunit-like protein
MRGRQKGPRTEKQLANDARLRVAQKKPHVPSRLVHEAAGMSVDDRLAYYKLRLENRFAFWKPYPKQMEFLSLGAEKRERLLRGGNKTGKTWTGAGEAVAHLTGRYPPWWPGIRYDRPTLVWSGGATGVAVRDGPQTILCGLPGDKLSLGTGMIPKDLIVGDPPTSRSAPNGMDSIIVRHITGGNSKLVFKTYAQGDGQGTGSWEGPYVDVIWLDEEAPMAVYQEALARLTGQGRIYTTFTPKQGYSLLVKRFMREQSPNRGVMQITLEDAEHFTEEEKQLRREGYLAHEIAYREFGDPGLGEGSVFTVPEQDLRVSMSLGSVPLEWRKLWSLDFGAYNHPFAAVLWAFDLENDMDYILHSIKMTTPPGNPAILGHCDAIKRVAARVPVAWPPDGHVQEKDSGEPLADIYKGYGLLMLSEHSTFPTGGYSTRAGIDALDHRMQQRKLQVRNCPENEKWFEEYRAYHYKDDKVVKDFDDLMSATRVGYIMRRKARAVPLGPGGQVARRPAIRDFDLFTGLPVEA